MKEEDLEAMRESLSKRRAYAAMREGGTKEQKEFYAVADLLESMAKVGDERFTNPQVASEDPPDCTVDAADGVVALEVTEFVSQDAIEHNERARRDGRSWDEPGAFVFADWGEDEFLAHLRRLLEEKDGKTLLGGPYARYVVLIHSDERFLMRDECEAWLDGQTFGPFSQIDEAYLLYQYEPGVGYPYGRLELAPGD